MTVESVQINTVYPHADDRYECVEATVCFAVDPEHLANQRIADLKLAPRHDDGLVRFDADLRMLRPIDGGNGKMLFVVPNRGLPTYAPWLKGGFSPTAHPNTGTATVRFCTWTRTQVRTCLRIPTSAPI